MAEFDLKELVAKAHFDYVGPAFPLWWGNNKTAFVFPDLKKIATALRNGTSPYFMTVRLKDPFGIEHRLPNEPLVALSLTKTIVETATVGRFRNGTVKEYITTEDYQISFRGVCFSDFDEEGWDDYPSDQVEAINTLFDIDDALEVVDNPFFELFGIRSLVLKDIQFDEMAGQQGLQKYTITAVSDQDFYADLSEQGRLNALL